MLRSSLKHLLLGTVLLAAAGASAHADTLTQTIQFGPAQTDYSGTRGTTPFLYLDSSLFTLNSVTFSSTYSFASSIMITGGGSASSGSVSTQSAAQFGATDSAVTGVLNSAVNRAGSVAVGGTSLSPVAYNLAGSRTAYNVAAGTTTQNYSNGSASTGPFTDTNAADLSAFFKPGGGSFNILFSTLTALNLAQSGGNASAYPSTTATGTLSIQYNYTAVPPPPIAVTPEPSSLILLGTGVLGLLGAARRRLA